MNLKLKLEQIWKDAKCRCPSNIIWWMQTSHSAIDNGGRKLGIHGYQESDKIYWAKGKRNRLRK